MNKIFKNHYSERFHPTANTSIAMQQSSRWLSILIPAFNTQDYIRECLDSLLVQNLDGVEIVVVNDGSLDDTGNIVAGYQQRHSEIFRVLNHAVSQGVAVARNLLVDSARGDYLWFVDADDTMTAGAVDGLRRVVASDAPDLVLCDYSRGRSRPGRRGTPFCGPSRVVLNDPCEILSGMLESGQLHPWSKITSRRLWVSGPRFPAGRVFEDVAVMPRLAIRAATAVHVPEQWIFYRQRPGSILASMNPRKCIDLSLALVDFPRDVRERGLQLSDRAEFALWHYAARHFVGVMRHSRAWPNAAIRRQTQGECLELFLQAIERRLDQLLFEYLRRGWMWRWMRLRHWVQVATAAA